MKKSSTLLVALTMGTLLGAASAQAAEKVVLGELNWIGSKVMTEVLKAVIADNYNVEVDVVKTNNAVAYESMDRGVGEIDVHTNVWMPAQDSFTKKYVDEKHSVVLTGPVYAEATGSCIPGFIQDEYGIKSVSDLANAKAAALFDSDGDGKGEFYPGPTGDQSTALETVKAREYGYDPYFSIVNMDYDVFDTSVLRDAFAKKKGVLFVCWTPNWMWQAYDLRMIEEPAFTAGCMDGMVYPADDPDWFNKAKVACSEPPGDVHLAYAATLKDRAADVAGFLDRVKLDTATVSKWILDANTGGTSFDAEAYAKTWVKDNPDVVNKWLGL